MKINPFRALSADFDQILSPDTFCDNAKNAYIEYRSAGLFQKMPKSALYIYQIKAGHRSHVGLIAHNDVADFHAGKVRKHENTLNEREQEQIKLFMEWDAVLKPILLTYPSVPAIQQALEILCKKRPAYSHIHFQKDHQRHHIWAITEPEDIKNLQELFEKHIKNVYIADGHHRTATMVYLHEQHKGKATEYDFNHLYAAYFGSDQLDILDYNRVIEGTKSIGIPRLMVALGRLFEITPLDSPHKPQSKHEIVMYLENDWFSLRWRPELLARHDGDKVLLDANLLNEHVIQNIFDIQEIRTDTRINYIEGSKGLKGVCKMTNRKRNHRVGFILYPVAIGDMMQLADNRESLPPKSTYFEPRLRTGVLVSPFRVDSVTDEPTI